MLGEVRGALRQLMYDHGRISPLEVDVGFEPPTRDWVERLTRPTLNLYLFDVRENTDLRQTALQAPRRGAGPNEAVRRQPPRRIDLSFMVSALTTEIEDEERLLWRLLSTLMKYPELPADVLPDGLRGLQPPLTARVERSDHGPSLLDLWSGLGTRPHPALVYIVTVPLDMDVAITSPLVLTRTARYTDLRRLRAPDTRVTIAGTVRGPDGSPLAGVAVAVDGRAAPGHVTAEDGRFALGGPGLAEGEVKLRVTPPDRSPRIITVVAPAESYEIVLE